MLAPLPSATVGHLSSVGLVPSLRVAGIFLWEPFPGDELLLSISVQGGPALLREGGRRSRFDSAAEPDQPKQQLHGAQLQEEENVLQK